MNMAGMVSGSLLVLYVQEVLHQGATVFAIIGMGRRRRRRGGRRVRVVRIEATAGSGTCLAIHWPVSAVIGPLVGLARCVPMVFVLFAVEKTLLGHACGT